MKRGALILFEGVDRCGKTTQAKRLVDTLCARGQPTIFMRFPDRETPIGQIINAYLTNATELDDHAIHLIYAANRWEKRAAIAAALAAGQNVVLDRYAYSGVAFSAAKAGMDLQWCKTPDAGLPRPDAILYMVLSPEAAAARGGYGGERYETTAFQAAVRGRFETLKAEVQASAPGVWVDVDAAGSIEEVAARVEAAAAPALTAAAAGTSPLVALWDGAPFDLAAAAASK